MLKRVTVLQKLGISNIKNKYSIRMRPTGDKVLSEGRLRTTAEHNY